MNGKYRSGGRDAVSLGRNILRRCTVLCIAACLTGGGIGPSAATDSRQIVPLADGWKFYQGDMAEAELPKYDDERWDTVEVPHDWSIAGPFDKDNSASGEGAFLPTGVAWYRKQVPTTVSIQGKRIFLELDGVMANSDVWVNGHHLGHRPNGYVSLRYDLTDHLDTDGSPANVIAVRVDTKDQVASRWYTGSGIYREARLVVVDSCHLDDRTTFVTTPRVSASDATVDVATTIHNTGPERREFLLRTIVKNHQGVVVAAGESQAVVDPNEDCEVNITHAIKQPTLWDTDRPAMYHLESSLVAHDVTLDKLVTPFGIRTAEFRPATGFWLNGRNIKLKGVCLHHDGGAFGAAVPASLWRDRLAKLRSLGVNAIRTAHNPPDPKLLDLCDRMGFLVMHESFDCWTVGKRRHDYHLYFEEWSDRDLRETIYRDRNHPSIVLYSVGNEIRDTPRPERAKAILERLVEACHETDSTRPVTQALFRPNASGDYDNGLADMLDVIGTNYRDAELLHAWRDNPNRKIVGTEQSHERATWLACRDNPHHAGQFLWVGVDYLGESRRWPITTFDTGLLDRTGHPYPRAFERQSWWSEDPMVRMFRRVAATEATPTDPGYESEEWIRRRVLFDDWTPTNLDSHQEVVEVYSNCEEVELSLNGTSLGSQRLPDDASPRTWRVDFVSGSLVAIGRNAGEQVARHELHTAGPAHGIRLTSNRSDLPSDWDEVAVIEAQIVDQQGVPVPRGSQRISFEAKGPATIVAVDNGSITSHEPFQAASRSAHHGRCVAMLRGTRGVGTVRVTASAEGLETGVVEINVVE